MNSNSVKGDTIEARLRYLGANNVQKIQGVLYFVTFKINDTEVSYTYNINAKDKYFLQRIKPYPLPEGIFSDEEQVVEFIKRDLKKFRNAEHSHNFSQFLELNNKLGLTSKQIENLFLNYNIDKESLEALSHELAEINRIISEAKIRSAHIIV